MAVEPLRGRAWLCALLGTWACTIVPRRVEERETPSVFHAPAGASGKSHMAGTAGSGGLAGAAKGGAPDTTEAGGGGGGGAAGDEHGLQPAEPCDLEAGFGDPVLLDDLNVQGSNHLDVWLSPDELTAYVLSDRPQNDYTTVNNIWIASRPTLEARFGEARLLAGANGSWLPFSLAMTADGLTMVVEQNQKGAGYCGPICREDARAQIYTRAGGDQAFVPRGFLAPVGAYSPWLNQDGSRLYFSNTEGVSLLERMGDEYIAAPEPCLHCPTTVPGLDYGWENVVLSADELTLFGFNYDGGAPSRLKASQRTSLVQPFGPPLEVLPSAADLMAFPTWLSRDCSRLYFVGDHDGGRALYRTDMRGAR